MLTLAVGDEFLKMVHGIISLNNKTVVPHANTLNVSYVIVSYVIFFTIYENIVWLQ